MGLRRTSQLTVPLGVVGIVMLLVVPMPSALLDFLIAVDIVSGRLVLMTARPAWSSTPPATSWSAARWSSPTAPGAWPRWARFTLEAMPGERMATDADSYGAMDGSAKLVEGDAIAGTDLVGGSLLVGGGLLAITQRAPATPWTCRRAPTPCAPPGRTSARGWPPPSRCSRWATTWTTCRAPPPSPSSAWPTR